MKIVTVALALALVLVATAAVRAQPVPVVPPPGVPAWPWFAIAKCEQGVYDRRTGVFLGVNWRAWSRTYEGGYGFWHERRRDGSYRGTWQTYRLPWMPARASDASPRVQTIVAMILRRTFGNYSSWPACRGRLGLA